VYEFHSRDSHFRYRVKRRAIPAAYRGVGWGVQLPSPPKFRRPSKIVPNSTRLWKLLKIAEFGMPTPQDVPKNGSKILKLPPVRNCFTLAMTNKLVVVINSLKVPKIKKLLLYEMKFLVPNYSCLQNPWLGGYRPQIPVLPVLNWICWTPPPEQNSWVGHWALLRFFVFLLSLPRQMLGRCLRSGRNLTVPHRCVSLLHLCTYHSTLRRA